MKTRVLAFVACSAVALCATAWPDSEVTEQVKHGSYLVHRVAMCVQCHSARTQSGDLDEYKLLKGAVMPLSSPFPYQVWAFQAPQLAGLPTGYSENDVVTLLMQGKSRTGISPRHPMPPYRMTEPDARSVAVYLAWVGKQAKAQDVSLDEETHVITAAAKLSPAEGSKVSGLITFMWSKGVLQIQATVSGLTPGLHGLSINKNTDCADAELEHFNPEGQKHDSPSFNQRHLGDLGNVVTDENGNGHYERYDAKLALDGTNSIIGLTITVHETFDDLKTQPNGNAGKAVACGVIVKK